MVNVDEVVQNLVEYELDPEKIPQEQMYGTVIAIQKGLNLDTLPACRTANDMLLKATQVISYKKAECHRHERKLTDQLKHAHLKAKYALIAADPDYSGSASQSNMMDEKASLDPEVIKIQERLTNAQSSRYFWEQMLDTCYEVAKRVDSASASLGVEAKLRNTGG
jgi:hypothetical protein